MNKKELRNKFFKEHTYKCENGIPKVITHPHNLFEWMYEQLTITDVLKRYDVNKYTPPFRVGRKQGKAVLDSKGLEVVFFMHSEEQAKMYCDYLNNV